MVHNVRPTRLRAAMLYPLLALLMGLASPSVRAANPTVPITVTVTRIFASGGQLFAQVTATAANQSVTQIVPVTLTGTPSNGSCPILNLSLAPINLNLLGLQVTTSAICLDISASRGPNNLLGNLLCSVANLLNRGISLQTILGSLNPNQLNTLLSGLTGLLNGALSNLLAATPTLGTPTQGGCTVLHLALGPVDLTLLGLNVHLDNCANGPVTVDIEAIPGGGLLGDLLCQGLTLLQQCLGNLTAANVVALLQQLVALVGQGLTLTQILALLPGIVAGLCP